MSKLLPALAAALFLSVSATAAHHYLAPDVVDVKTLLAPPPAPDSIVQRAELDVLFHLQSERTPAQVKHALEVDAEDIFSFGSGVLGDWFNAKNLPETGKFFAQVRNDYVPYNRAAKGLFNRRRPPYVDARIKPCVEVMDTGSYPSGHGLQSSLWAGLLSAIFPEQANAFAEHAATTRWSRLQAGVHFPSDVEAGRVLGETLAREMLKNPALQQVIERLRTEAAPYLHKQAA